MNTNQRANLQQRFPGSHFPWLFLFLAYGLVWLLWIPVALTRRNYQQSPIFLVPMFLGVFAPGIAGIVLTYREQGLEGGRDYWRRVFDFRRISIKWYLLIILLFAALHLLVSGLLVFNCSAIITRTLKKRLTNSGGS